MNETLEKIIVDIRTDAIEPWLALNRVSQVIAEHRDVLPWSTSWADGISVSVIPNKKSTRFVVWWDVERP